jgi:hypothetical protein
MNDIQTLGGVASFLAWRKTRQIDFEEFAAAQFAYGPAPNDANAAAAPQPQGQANAHALANSSEDSDAESRLENRPAAGAGQGSDSDETGSIDESVANMDAASSVSGSETGQCCVCMSKPRNAVIYKYANPIRVVSNSRDLILCDLSLFLQVRSHCCLF